MSRSMRGIRMTAYASPGRILGAVPIGGTGCGSACHCCTVGWNPFCACCVWIPVPHRSHATYPAKYAAPSRQSTPNQRNAVCHVKRFRASTSAGTLAIGPTLPGRPPDHHRSEVPAHPPSSRCVCGPAYTANVDVPSPLLEPLNPIQREAVLHTEGPVLIVAGAGSGKTRALTHRVAYLIREQGVSPFEILAITFTNKAAREMAERVEGLLGTRVAKGMWILTFHSSCARILRREHNHLGLPSTFSIYDEGDTERVLTLVLKDLNLDPKRWPPRAMSSAIGKAKDELWSPAQLMERAGNFYDRQVAEVYAGYERRLRAAGALDFDDLISETARLFRDHPEVLEHYQERFRYILVDEYQDTNRAQYHLVNLLAAKYRNLCVLSYADQGVSTWR